MVAVIKAFFAEVQAFFKIFIDLFKAWDWSFPLITGGGDA